MKNINFVSYSVQKGGEQRSISRYLDVWREIFLLQWEHIPFSVDLTIHQHVGVHAGAVDTRIIASGRTTVTSKRAVDIFVSNLQ